MAQRKYGLFEIDFVNGKKKYTRLLPNLAFTKQMAASAFQNYLLAGALGITPKVRCLRPVKEAQ